MIRFLVTFWANWLIQAIAPHAEQAIRTFQDYQTEGTLVRDVSVDMLLLEPDRTPLYVLTNNSKRKKSVYNPIFEWPEDQDLPMLGTVSNGTTALASNATNIPVQDVTIFGVNDMVQVPTGGDIGTGIEELVLITAVTIGWERPQPRLIRSALSPARLPLPEALQGPRRELWAQLRAFVSWQRQRRKAEQFNSPALPM